MKQARRPPIFLSYVFDYGVEPNSEKELSNVLQNTSIRYRNSNPLDRRKVNAGLFPNLEKLTRDVLVWPVRVHFLPMEI